MIEQETITEAADQSLSPLESPDKSGGVRLLIYCHSLTPRVSYTMDLVFKTVLNLSFRLTDDLPAYKSSSLPKLAYTNQQEGIGFFIQPEGLLFENTIRKQLPEVSGSYLDLPVFFKTSANSFLPCDLFATVFYVASRCEEYLPSELDAHQRFRAENSLAFKHGILNKPFLNYLIEDLARKLKQAFPALEFKKRAFNFLSTIDVDNAFAFANKGFKRNLGGLVKDLVSLKLSSVTQRIVSNINSGKDPYNTFDAIAEISSQTGTALQYFVLIGDHSAYDKNPRHTSKGFRTLLKKLSSGYVLGLHPSYQSFSQTERIEKEKNRLENIIEKKVSAARCHFLRLEFPGTYRAFINAGITDDYTMIYASQSGFRTGLCMPYQWFDLEKNEATHLTLHTSVVMEGTLRDYNQLGPKAATELVSQLMQEVKKFGGEFVSVWHNDSFVPEQKEWIEVYRKMLMKI